MLTLDVALVGSFLHLDQFRFQFLDLHFLTLVLFGHFSQLLFVHVFQIVGLFKVFVQLIDYTFDHSELVLKLGGQFELSVYSAGCPSFACFSSRHGEVFGFLNDVVKLEFLTSCSSDTGHLIVLGLQALFLLTLKHWQHILLYYYGSQLRADVFVPVL